MNPYSKKAHDTPGSRLVLEHYRDIGLIHGWDRERTLRLCKLMGITPVELGRLCCVFPSPSPGDFPSNQLFMGQLKNNRIPPYVALHFAILEAWITEALSRHNSKPVAVKPVMPVNLLYTPKEEQPHHD